MAIDKLFSDEIQQLRGKIDGVNGSSVQRLDHNGRYNVQQIRAFADRAGRFADKLDAADAAITKFARIYEAQWMAAHTGDAYAKRAVDEARAELLRRIDALEAALDGVELNDYAKATFGDGP